MGQPVLLPLTIDVWPEERKKWLIWKVVYTTYTYTIFGQLKNCLNNISYMLIHVVYVGGEGGTSIERELYYFVILLSI